MLNKLPLKYMYDYYITDGLNTDFYFKKLTVLGMMAHTRRSYLKNIQKKFKL